MPKKIDVYRAKFGHSWKLWQNLANPDRISDFTRKRMLYMLGAIWPLVQIADYRPALSHSWPISDIIQKSVVVYAGRNLGLSDNY